MRKNGDAIGELSDDNKMLGYYSVTSGMEIHVLDTDPYSLSRGGGLTDTSLIEKYKMTEEAYDQREGTLRDYIRKQKAINPNFKMKPKVKDGLNESSTFTPMGGGDSSMDPPPGPESVEGITIGSRCEVYPGARRGTIRYIGEVDGLKSGYWVSLCYVCSSNLILYFAVLNFRSAYTSTNLWAEMMAL